METNNLPEIQRKSNAFASYAVESHNLLASLKKRADHVIAKLSNLPTKIEDIAEYEKIYKECKKESDLIKEDRLIQTRKLDKFLDNFAIPENKCIDSYKKYASVLIELKNKKEIAELDKKNKDAELKKIKETFLIHINSTKAAHEQVIIDYVTNRYAYSLKHAKDANTIVVEGNDMPLSDYVMKCQCAKKVSDFVITQPIFIPKYATPEQLTQIWNECESVYLDGKLMLGKFEGDVKEKFKYFSIALKDKEKALAHNENQANEAKEQAANQAEQMNIGAKLSVTASVLDNGPAIKPLNQKFEIDMESNEKNALTIMVAFATNIDKVRGKVKADWMKLSVAQMGAALAAVKNEDNNFNVSGITFKIIQKL